ncbi:MAG: hypothetical protein ACRENO_09675 [Thermodesulfobacteriota bacterium]
MINSKINYETTTEISGIISNIGRTEDVKFSPDNKRFVIAEFLENKIHLFSIDVDRTLSPLRISIPKYSLITSSNLNQPHGICFLDNDHIVVCNRKGDVSIFKIPQAVFERKEHNIEPVKIISGKGFLFAKLKSPGSVDCYKISDSYYRIFVCNNYWHIITSHTIKIGDSVEIKNEGVLIENALNIPDGISFSSDQNWIAISNHVNGKVLIYKYTPGLNRNTPPAATLKGSVCPHGLRFSRDGDRLFVADAASQYLHIYEVKDGNWSELQNSGKSIRVLEDEMFYIGRYASGDGGVKGIDIDNSNSLLVSTTKQQVIGFYDLNEFVGGYCVADNEEIAELCSQRDTSLNRQRGSDLNRRWTLKSRLKHSFKNRYFQVLSSNKKTRDKIRLNYLYFKNKRSKESILDPSGPVLSLTTFEHRLNLVFYAIESIGRGSSKPSRIILWLNEEYKNLKPPKTLERLISRGLEIQFCTNYVSHKKYYPYLERESEFNKPLVTADDDILYPKYWLQKLIEAYKAEPSIIHCYRANRISLNNKQFLPYNEWEFCLNSSPSHGNFITGVSGVIYPPEFLQYLKAQGDLFLNCCPKADDIWLNVNALRAGFKIAQINDTPIHFNIIPGSQKHRLMNYNVTEGGNQIQLIKTFTKEDIEKLDLYLQSEKNDLIQNENNLY